LNQDDRDQSANAPLIIRVIEEQTGEDILDALVTASAPQTKDEISRALRLLYRPSVAHLPGLTMGGGAPTNKRVVGYEGQISLFAAAEERVKKQEYLEALRVSVLSYESWLFTHSVLGFLNSVRAVKTRQNSW
jgi:hypothetical protein